MYKDTKWAKEIISLQDDEGKWDMGKGAKDGVYFPLSNDWRKKETREFDCTNRIMKLLDKLGEH